MYCQCCYCNRCFNCCYCCRCSLWSDSGGGCRGDITVLLSFISIYDYALKLAFLTCKWKLKYAKINHKTHFLKIFILEHLFNVNSKFLLLSCYNYFFISTFLQSSFVYFQICVLETRSVLASSSILDSYKNSRPNTSIYFTRITVAVSCGSNYCSYIEPSWKPREEFVMSPMKIKHSKLGYEIQQK